MSYELFYVEYFEPFISDNFSRYLLENNLLFLLVNPLPLSPVFLRICGKNLWKTLWEKEKLLIMSTYSFFHNVFYPIEVFQLT